MQPLTWPAALSAAASFLASIQSARMILLAPSKQ
jgi:hypothetical protein